MGCFCKTALTPLNLALPSLNVTLPALPNAQLALSLSAWLGARGLPAAPFSPNPAWLDIALPTLSMRAEAMATVSAIASLRAEVMAQFGLDLLVSAQASMFARIAATLSARLSASLSASLSAGLNVGLGFGMGWMQLASLNFAIDQISLALSLGLFLNAGAYAAMPSWNAFLGALRALLPLIAIGMQLGLDLQANFSAELSASIRAMLAISLPPLPTATLSAMASLSATLSAVASLSASLNISALSLGFPAVQAMVSARLSAMLPSLSASFGISLSAPGLLAAILAMLPSLPFCPTSAVTSEVVGIAMSLNAQAVASLNWQAPAISAVALLQVGLPVVSLSAQLNAALGITAALSPCLMGCDANAVLKAAF